jgi:hypothetical protein
MSSQKIGGKDSAADYSSSLSIAEQPDAKALN